MTVRCGEPGRLVRELLPKEVHDRVWLAGGTVRDLLLGRPIKDLDLVVALSADRLAALGFRPVEAKTAGSIWFRAIPAVGKVEITRIDAAGDLEADLRRRDFTVNAMLMTLTGALIDPLGGRDDLDATCLRPCSDASFSSDPLRIFRAFRFVAEGFSLGVAAAALIRSRDWEERLAALPVERFSGEMLKALAAPQSYQFFRAMVAYGVGSCWLPELFRMPQVPAGPATHHPEGDLLSHAGEVLERVSAMTDSPLTRFCAFFHDLGKLATDPAAYPHHHGHEEAGARSARRFCQRLALPTVYGRSLALVCGLHGKFNRFDRLRPATRIGMAEQAIRGGVEAMLPVIAAADKQGEDRFAAWETVVAVVRQNSRELGIDMARLQAMQPEQRREAVLQRRIVLLKNC